MNGEQPPAGLALALHGWIAFIDQVSITWLERGRIDRGALRELLAREFVAILTAIAPSQPARA